MAGPRVTFDTARLCQISAERPQKELTRCRAMRQRRLATRFRLVQRVSPSQSVSEGSAFVSPLL
jgi:hypothetical protein